MKDNICKRCHKDHNEEGVGPLTVCEREAYFAMGAVGKTKSNEKIQGFGLGQGRFQFKDKK